MAKTAKAKTAKKAVNGAPDSITFNITTQHMMAIREIANKVKAYRNGELTEGQIQDLVSDPLYQSVIRGALQFPDGKAYVGDLPLPMKDNAK